MAILLSPLIKKCTQHKVHYASKEIKNAPKYRQHYTPMYNSHKYRQDFVEINFNSRTKDQIQPFAISMHRTNDSKKQCAIYMKRLYFCPMHESLSK